ncbi:MAG TPA: hypothetical protein VLH35_06965, partial [Candidatus Acidoferrales bacterium]|nr:hypothetical protein [Candidatus Acidoferrales bacterium]
NYILDEEESWEFPYETRLGCPIDWLDEFLISATNVPPTYEEIKRKDFTGLHNARLYLFGFSGKGWPIFAINIWGWADSKRH